MTFYAKISESVNFFPYSTLKQMQVVNNRDQEIF